MAGTPGPPGPPGAPGPGSYGFNTQEVAERVLVLMNGECHCMAPESGVGKVELILSCSCSLCWSLDLVAFLSQCSFALSN